MLVDGVSQCRFRHCADYLLNNLTGFEQEEAGNAFNGVCLCCLRIFIRIQFNDFQTAIIFLGKILNYRRYCLARTTPWSPKIYENWKFSFENFLFESVVCHAKNAGHAEEPPLI